MDVDRALVIYGPRIEAMAKEFYISRPIVDRDDLIQTGRITLWELATQHPEMLSNEAYVNSAVRNAMRDALPKREPYTDSIYRNVFDEGSLTLEETIPSSVPSPETIVVGEAVSAIFDFGAAYQRRFERETAEIYGELLVGRRKCTPNGFWKGEVGQKRARFCFRRFLGAIDMTPREFIQSNDCKVNHPPINGRACVRATH